MNTNSIVKASAILIIVVAIWPHSLQATFPGANGVISYSHVDGPYSYGSEYHIIRAINQDGTNEHNLLSDYYVFTWAGPWSSDGKKYLYERGDLNPHEIWQANADGSFQEKITTATCTVDDPS